MSRTYRLKVRKIPLPNDIVYRKPSFEPFKELQLEFLENKDKLKKNAPKPTFVRRLPTPPPKASHTQKESFSSSSGSSKKKFNDDDDDFTLKELEDAYLNGESDDDEYSDEPYSEGSPDQHNDRDYKQEEFDKEEEEQESEEDRENRERADLLFKFMVLRRQYPNVEIPEFSDHSDVPTMKRVYENIIRRVSLDSSVDSYKQYLVGGLMVMEWVSTNWLGIDLGGFTQQQMKAMGQYDRLLIELGEKNYSTAASRFPVEVRLLFFIVFNAGLFFVQKMIFSGNGGGGPNIMGSLFGGMGGGNPQPQAAPSKPVRRGRTMRGPTISPQDIEEMSRPSPSPSEFDHDKYD